MKRVGQVALAVLGLVVGMVAVLALREATLSTHRRVTDASRTRVVLEARIKGASPGQTRDEAVEAVLLGCRLEVSSDIDVEPRHLGDGVYVASLTPPLDESNRRQFRGCLEDWAFDHVRVDVLTLQSV